MKLFILLAILAVVYCKVWTESFQPGVPTKAGIVTTTETSIGIEVTRSSISGVQFKDIFARRTGRPFDFPPATSKFLLGDVLLISKMDELNKLLVHKNGVIIAIMDDDSFPAFDTLKTWFETNL